MKTPNKPSGITPEELTSVAGSDPLVEYMIQHNKPLTRKVYLALSYPDREEPMRLTAEEESMLPEPFQEGVDPTPVTSSTEESGSADSPPSDLVDLVARRHGVTRKQAQQMLDESGY